jgi:hypothetical protein
MSYGGYLHRFASLITDAHARGLGTREIAELLFEAGARADHGAPPPTREDHIKNLRTMTLYALIRLGLRERKHRGGLQLNATRGKDGAWSVPSAAIHPEKNSAATRQGLAAEGETKACPLDTIQRPDTTP